MSIRTRADIERGRLCGEIRGTLTIEAVGIEAISGEDFPSLTKITGDLVITGFHALSGSVNLRKVTLSKLERIDGAVLVQSAVTPGVSDNRTGPVDELHLPVLTTVGNREGRALFLNLSSLQVLQMPMLMTAGGAVVFNAATDLCVLNLGALTRVQGDVSLAQVPRLPASAFDSLRAAAAGTVTQSEVGCCWPNTIDRVSCSSILNSWAKCRVR